MYRLFKVCVVVVVSVAHFFTFGMNRADKLPSSPRAIVCIVPETGKKPAVLALERAYRHFDGVAQITHETKLLEHSCFIRKSLRFQSDFFSSNYMDVPDSLALAISLITRDVSINPRRFIFEYHAYHRGKCKDLIESFIRSIGKKSMLYNRHIQKLLDGPDGVQRFMSINRMRYDDLVPQKEVCLDMIEAYNNNHYPLVLKLYQQYYDMPK